MRLTKTIHAMAAAIAVVRPLTAQVPSPEESFGWAPGGDYEAADYDRMQSCFHRLAEATDRAEIMEIGHSAIGRPMLLLFISSTENTHQLDRWRSISERLARVRIDEAEARSLAA